MKSCLLLLTLIQLSQAWKDNTFLQVSHQYAKDLNVSGCWVCSHIPHDSKGGIPMMPVPFNWDDWCASWKMNHPNKNESACEGRGTNITFEGWYERPTFNVTSTRPTPFIQFAVAVKGLLCFANNGSNHMGNSTCNCTLSCYQNTTVPVTNSSGSFAQPVKLNATCNFTSNFTNQGMRTSNGTYFICGKRAYWLSADWAGSCYIGYITPAIRHSPSLPSGIVCNKHAMGEGDRFFSILFPMYGVGRTIKEVRLLASVLEQVSNDTAESLHKLTAEMVAIRSMVLQNRMALDFNLAAKGGVCALIGTECCTYIPDNEEQIHDLTEHIRKEVTKLHQTPSSWGAWLSGLLGDLGTTMVQGLLFFFGIVICVYFCFLLIKCCCTCMAGKMQTELESIGQKESARLMYEDDQDEKNEIRGLMNIEV
ncbi:endogenous retrovirus group PABLB member 1 Env polyprotein-like [Huso huso]|uniref:Endogenous retrovirus group PABLB member 1 Env polyprotein-like n=1 Tax=Huso huso TaxID=61971 RepID=A0ABR0Z365_HUSHU